MEHKKGGLTASLYRRNGESCTAVIGGYLFSIVRLGKQLLEG